MISRRHVLLSGGVAAIGSAAKGPTEAREAMVSAASAPAVDVGVEILKRGGNAVDAAVAVGFAEAVTWPAAGNIGGGGFMLIQMAGGKSAVIDYRETAPRRAHRDMYRGADGKPDGRLSTVGHLSCGVPGTVAGLALAHRKFGALRWREVIAPAVALARDGFALDENSAGMLHRSAKLLGQFPESNRIFLRGGRHYAGGEMLRQPELSATLERIAKKGPAEFYEGETARMLVEEMRRGGGWIEAADLRAYRAVERLPLRGSYRGNEIVSLPPTASGGAVLLAMLNMLEGYDLAKMRSGSVERFHLLAEVMKRAFADRSAYIGDPAFVKAPIRGMISKAYARERAAGIDLKRATPAGEIRQGEPARHESSETTHFSVVDGQGNAVSNTYTLRNGFGSGVTVAGAGFLLNDVMDDFATQPGQPNTFGFVAGEANAIAPGKRPVSSQTPTIVNKGGVNKGGKLWFALGSPGGPTISNTVLQVILNVIEDGMDLQQAVDAPRVHHQWTPDILGYEGGGLTKETIAALEAMGHAVRTTSRDGSATGGFGQVNAVGVNLETGARTGANDRRNPSGKAAGY
ncbi:MAG: gamma-glutamyltransferase [Bryobacteraceae bacterium]